MRTRFPSASRLLLSLSLFPTAALAVCLATTLRAQTPAPHLETRGVATQLIVDGQPYLILGGELLNSSSSSLHYMEPIWPRLAKLNLNTVLTPLSWDLIEPTEGHFDFQLVDGLLAQARQNHMHIVFLWLASWKNGMSSYAPVWVKQDTRRFPRVVLDGHRVEVLSPMGETTLQADAAAFTALMKHLKAVDGQQHTVLMMQVENESGILESARDHSDAADTAFAQPVPQALTSYLKAHSDSLNPDLKAIWDQNGRHSTGTWAQVFGVPPGGSGSVAGDTLRADEIFMAWHYARFVQAVAASGKAAYDIPMYVNTWLGGATAKPGDYPSGGSQPRVLDIWRAAGTAIDLFAPDLYSPDFAGWARLYHRPDNPLFIPETHSGYDGASNVFYALGEQAAIGFSPFAIDHTRPPGTPPASPTATTEYRDELGDSYQVLAQIAPQLLAAQSAGQVHGFLLDKAHPTAEFQMNGYDLHVSLDELFGNQAEKGYGLIMTDPAAGKNAFLGAGRGFRVIFSSLAPAGVESAGPLTGLASVEEGTFAEGKWIPGRRLNGDETEQGVSWRFDQSQTRIERATVYQAQ